MKAQYKILSVILVVAHTAALSPVSAQTIRTVSADSTQIIAAAKELTSKLARSTEEHMPVTAIRSAEITPLFYKAFDIAGIRALPSDQEIVITTCQSVSLAYLTLSRFVGSTAQDNARALTIQNEVITATLAATLCGKRMVRVVDGFVVNLSSNERNDRTRRGPRQIVEGVATMLGSVLQLQSDPGISTFNRTRLLEGLSEELDALAAALPLDRRAKVRTEILEYAQEGSTATRATLTRMAARFERLDCGTTCDFLSGK